MKRGHVFAFIALAVLTVLALCLNLGFGSADISVSETVGILLRGGSGTAYDIITKIRVPRALSALILGGALALAGYLLQMFFRNPIAGPFVLGVSSGAKLTAALVMIGAAASRVPLSSAAMVGAAFIGSMASLAFVLLISRRVRGMSMLVVCGVMIGYICTAVTDFVITFAQDSDIANLHSWSVGSFSGMTTENVIVILAVTVPALVGSFLLSKPLGAYGLGEEYAVSMGVNVRLLRTALIFLSGLLAACVTAFAGPVSFVGIAVPHIIRRVFRTSKPIILIPACFLGGGIFCMLCDMLARTVFAPTELGISTVTAIFGAPVVILMMIRGKRGGMNG